MKINKGRVVTIIVVAVLTVIASYGVYRAEAHISSYEFCTSCHSMTYPAQEAAKSRHAGALGFKVTCKDCHLPVKFTDRIFAHFTEGVHDTISHYTIELKTKEQFDKHRADFAHLARVAIKKSDSENCRNCHKAPMPASDYGKDKHKTIGKDGATCIDCHQNLVHEYVPEEDLAKGIAQGKIVLK